jgi:hypothetical protein
MICQKTLVKDSTMVQVSAHIGRMPVAKPAPPLFSKRRVDSEFDATD